MTTFHRSQLLQRISGHRCHWMIILVLALCLDLAAPAGKASAGGGHDLYVSPTGGITTCAIDDPCALAKAVVLLTDDSYTIHLASGSYLGYGLQFITGVTLEGPEVPPGSPPLAVLDGQNNGRVLEVNAPPDAGNPNRSVNLINLVIQNGAVTAAASSDGGAGLRCANSTLSLDHVTVRNNTLNVGTSTADVQGGGIYSLNCTLSINNSVISGNQENPTDTIKAWGGGIALVGGSNSINRTVIQGNTDGDIGGGGLSVSDGTTTLDQVTISGNTSHRGGGLFVNASTGSFKMTNSTVSGNHSLNAGGGMFLYNPATVVNSTFSDNHAQDYGGAVYLEFSGNLTANHVTIADNVVDSTTGQGANIYFSSGARLNPSNSIISIPKNQAGNNCAGTKNIVTGYHNIVSDASCWITLFPGSDKINTDPLLYPLADYGGPTLTRALRKGSPAIDWAAQPGPTDPTSDQRGYVYVGNPDAGAYEFDPLFLPLRLYLPLVKAT